MSDMILAAGDMADKLVSWGAFTTSTDGLLWTTPVNPFDGRGKAIGVASNSTTIFAASDAGLISSSRDQGITWTTTSIQDGNFSPMAIRFGTDRFGNAPGFMMVGQRKFLQDEGPWSPEFEPYFAMDEAAQIMFNFRGEEWGWRLAYSHDSPNSRFYNIRRLTWGTGFDNYDYWVALGSANNKPLVLYGTGNGSYWYEVNLPEISTLRCAYDIVKFNETFYITMNGIILNTNNLFNPVPVWGASQFLSVPYGNTDLTKMGLNPAGHMVAVCSGGLFYSLDQTGWTLFKQDGYRFKSIVWFNDQWVAGAESNLTTYTYWTSTDTVNWSPRYQPVQIYDFAVV